MRGRSLLLAAMLAGVCAGWMPATPLRAAVLLSRCPAPREAAPVSSLDSAKEHTVELQEALASVGPLLKRSSLRRLIARILDDPSLLPPGALDGEGDELEGGAKGKAPLERLMTSGDNDREEHEP